MDLDKELSWTRLRNIGRANGKRALFLEEKETLLLCNHVCFGMRGDSEWCINES